MTWFDHDGRPAAVDTTHPVDLLEPDVTTPERDTPSMIVIVEAIARTFLTGDPRITLVSWRILLGDEWDAIRACARRAGCTAAAISRRLGILSRQFNLRPPRRHVRRLARWQRQDAFHDLLKQKRREDRNPPAASDDQSKTTHHAEESGGRP